ncbi:MAG: hypothetical protein LH475_01900 [Cryobacterium sp.]|uniref:hypothetical protein n=1 Tax=unclassified Cryobacterium TaxID=2649013 RepID=UPI0018C96B4D|nr:MULTISPECIES: hypothetical protein [unclassified Cryobacterium]MCY7403383.1 hypothetical protein [Cryobacterium sp.]MEC5153450.1 hypothetical protein [Cryobacterium sp. CAN_C3]
MSAILPPTDELDVLVRQVAGVDVLYPAGSIVATVLTATIEAVAHRLPLAPKVVMEQRADGVKVTAKIGISAAWHSGDVSRRVHDAIAAQLRQSGNPPVAQIEVIVARIG